MRAFLQPISARIYFGKTASHRKRARFVQSRGAPPQAYWMSVKAAQRQGCAKRAFCGVCFLMPGGLRPGVVCVSINPRPCHSEPVTRADRVVRPYKLGMTALCAAGRCGHRHAIIRCGNAFSRRERQKTGQAACRLPCFFMEHRNTIDATAFVHSQASGILFFTPGEIVLHYEPPELRSGDPASESPSG